MAETVTKGPVILEPRPLPEDYNARAESFMQFLDSLDAEAIDDAADHLKN
jgi:hypothetical protein